MMEKNSMGDVDSELEAKCAPELAAFLQELAPVAIALARRVIAEGRAGTLDVVGMASGIECDQRGFARLQRVVDSLARAFPVTGYVVRLCCRTRPAARVWKQRGDFGDRPTMFRKDDLTAARPAAARRSRGAG